MHNPEQAKIINFPIERVRDRHVDLAIEKLEAAVYQIKPDVAPVIPLFLSPAEKEANQEMATPSPALDMQQAEAERLANIYRDIELA